MSCSCFASNSPDSVGQRKKRFREKSEHPLKSIRMNLLGSPSRPERCPSTLRKQTPWRPETSPCPATGGKHASTQPNRQGGERALGSVEGSEASQAGWAMGLPNTKRNLRLHLGASSFGLPLQPCETGAGIRQTLIRGRIRQTLFFPVSLGETSSSGNWGTRPQGVYASHPFFCFRRKCCHGFAQDSGIPTVKTIWSSPPAIRPNQSLLL